MTRNDLLSPSHTDEIVRARNAARAKERQAGEWPKRPDGTNKTVGEMSAPERDRVLADARARDQAKMKRPHP